MIPSGKAHNEMLLLELGDDAAGYRQRHRREGQDAGVRRRSLSFAPGRLKPPSRGDGGTGPAVSLETRAKGNDHETRHRQQGLFFLVAPALDAADRFRHPVRGGHHPPRYAGVPPRVAAYKAGQHGADPYRRRRHGLGVAGDHGLCRRPLPGQGSLARGISRLAPSPGRFPRRCMPASGACALPAR